MSVHEKNKLRKKLQRYKRGIIYTFSSIFLEKTRGLDFSMRDIHLIKETDGKMHGYCKATEAHVRSIFLQIDFDRFNKLLDIGCGKGAVLREATKYPFKKIDGVDIDGRLVKIANKNFEILGLADRVNCYAESATDFLHYDDYNIFFLFNPFGKEILAEVIKKVLQNRCTECCIIYYHPVYAEEIEKYDNIKKIGVLYDKERDYETYIYYYSPV